MSTSKKKKKSDNLSARYAANKTNVRKGKKKKD